jgi:hypothetical protein
MAGISDFNFGDLVDEACEQAGVDPSALTHRHLNSITRSLQLLHIEMENDGAVAEFRTETRSWELDADAGGVVLDADVIDVLDAVIVQDGKPYPLGRTTRQDFLSLSFPDATSFPNVYWLTKSIRTSGNTEQLPEGVTIPPAAVDTPVLVLWPQNGLEGDDIELRCNIYRQHAMPSALASELDTKRPWLPTLCAGLAAKLALKWNPANHEKLELIYQRLLRTSSAEEDRHPVVIAFRGFGFGRGRRH